MLGNGEHIADPERGESVPLDDLGGEAGSGPGTLEGPSYRNSGPGPGTTGNSSPEGLSRPGTHKKCGDFDDGANDLWSLYGKEAKTHDEARIRSLAEDMDGVLVFAGLFSAVITSFLVQSIQSLQVNPADQSVYYQNQSVYYQQQSVYYQQQSVAILAQISQQFAAFALQVSVPSIAPQVSTPPTVSQPSVPFTPQQVSIPSTSPPPYPPFTPQIYDMGVNVSWLTALVFSLVAAIIAVICKQWVRSYMQVFQQYDHPLKRARFRQFFFEAANGMRGLAEFVPALIHASLFLFLIGLVESLLHTNKSIGICVISIICYFGPLYVQGTLGQLSNAQSPYIMILLMWNILSKPLPRKWRGSTTIKASREELVMKETGGRKERDVRAIQWLVDNTTVNVEMEPFVLAIPGSFNTEWGRNVWIDVSSQGRSNPNPLESQTDLSTTGGLSYAPSYPVEGTTVDTISRCVRYVFETCHNIFSFPNDEARRRSMRGCVEAAASLVCCADFRLEWLGEVGKLLSEIGHIENINQSPTITSAPSFIIRWTCLSLVVTQRMLFNNRLREPAGYAVSGLARIQLDSGEPDDAAALESTQKIEEILKTAWECVEDLCRAFEPRTQERTRDQVREILRNHELQISELERIKIEADRMEDVDQLLSVYQDAMDDATYRLTRQLPGVSFDELHRPESFPISDTFNIPATGSAPVTPQLIFPGQQLQALTRLGLKLREVLDGQDTDGHREVLDSLKSVGYASHSLRRPDGLMKRQLWRLQDLRDGGGLGFTVELFFLSLKQLLSKPSAHESSGVFYEGTFKVITSHWERSRESLGTQRVLLNIICDLIIPDRGVFSNFSYPDSITTMLLEMVGKILQGNADADEHIRDAVREIESVDSSTFMDMELRDRALTVILRSVR